MFKILITVYNWIDHKKTDIFRGFVLQGNIERDLEENETSWNCLWRPKIISNEKLTFIINGHYSGHEIVYHNSGIKSEAQDDPIPNRLKRGNILNLNFHC